MIRIKADQVICFLVEQMLPRASDINKGLYFCLDAELENRKTSKKQNKKIHFIFHRPSNYTSVFVSTDKSFRPGADSFEFKCHHDSCWRDSVNSAICDIYFKMCDAIKEDDAPIKMNDSSHLDLSFSPKLLTVKIEPDTTDTRGYKKKITEINI